MQPRVTPLIHVPDVAATVAWYQTLGFRLVRSNEDDGIMNWAMLGLGDDVIMFDCAGTSSLAHRRELDLYIEIEGVDALFETLKDRVDVFEPPHDTEYGMREFIIRDLNRFWVTFGAAIERTVIV